MDDYSDVGVEKIARQASSEPVLIRCPRDGAVMRVASWRARRRDGSGETRDGTGRLPAPREWVLTILDVECPACGRRANGVAVGNRVAVPA
jgi:hypothetical protein